MLIVSIHDVAPRHLAVVRALRSRLLGWGAGTVTLLAVPCFHGEEELLGSRETVAFLREQARAGDEVALHGYYHAEQGPVRGLGARIKRRLLSAGEAEYLSLDRAGRAALLCAGRAVVEQALGARVRGFVAPAWLEPPGFAAELVAQGFAWHETGLCLERLGPHGVRVRDPVIGFATRTRARQLLAAAWARGLAPLVDRRARAGRGVARVALHPADMSSPWIMACAERVVRELARHHEAVSPSAALERLATRRLRSRRSAPSTMAP